MTDYAEKKGWTIIVKGEKPGEILERLKEVLGFQPTIVEANASSWIQYRQVMLTICVDPDREPLIEELLNKWLLQTRDAIPAPTGSLLMWNQAPTIHMRAVLQAKLFEDPVERVIEAMERTSHADA
jgi:hypothetical protein